MEKLIDINSYPVSVVLKALLKDKTTGKNIIFATSAYTENGRTINEKECIIEEILKGFGSDIIQLETQASNGSGMKTEQRGTLYMQFSVEKQNKKRKTR